MGRTSNRTISREGIISGGGRGIERERERERDKKRKRRKKKLTRNTNLEMLCLYGVFKNVFIAYCLDANGDCIRF
jgi:hypothetical protein